MDDIDEDQARDERVSIRYKFLDSKARATDIIESAKRRFRAPTDRNMLNAPDTSYSDLVVHEVALRKIQLPSFSGPFEDWPDFADQFRCTVHKNSRIEDCKKLMYLRSCLTQEATNAIASILNTAFNYPVAWEILEMRYNQPAKIRANYLKVLFDVSPLQRPSRQDIGAYVNELQTHYKALQALNQLTADTVLLYLFTSKLDHDTQLRRKERIDHKPFPSVGELFHHLHDRCNVLRQIGSTYQTPPHPTTLPYNIRVNSQERYTQSNAKPDARRPTSNHVQFL